jgi:hypothetical protein
MKESNFFPTILSSLLVFQHYPVQKGTSHVKISQSTFKQRNPEYMVSHVLFFFAKSIPLLFVPAFAIIASFRIHLVWSAQASWSQPSYRSDQ